jgi:hypothetical protein
MASKKNSDEKAARKSELFAKLREDNDAIDTCREQLDEAHKLRRGTITALATECGIKALTIDGDRYRVRKVADTDPVEYDLAPVKALDFVEVD